MTKQYYCRQVSYMQDPSSSCSTINDINLPPLNIITSLFLETVRITKQTVYLNIHLAVWTIHLNPKASLEAHHDSHSANQRFNFLRMEPASTQLFTMANAYLRLPIMPSYICKDMAVIMNDSWLQDTHHSWSWCRKTKCENAHRSRTAVEERSPHPSTK